MFIKKMIYQLYGGQNNGRVHGRNLNYINLNSGIGYTSICKIICAYIILSNEIVMILVTAYNTPRGVKN